MDNKKSTNTFKAKNEEANVCIVVEATPNPQSMKFCVNHRISEENWETEDISQAERSPLAQKILGFPWAKKVFIGPDFVTITKEDWVKWEILAEPLSQLIQEHIVNKETVLLPETPLNCEEKEADPTNLHIIEKIKHILQKDIQPAVATDGGFISFAGYEKGIVFLKMQGACAGCPSASLTLKKGVESHLKSQIPEVREVVAL